MTFDETKSLLERHGLRTLVLRREGEKGCLLIAPELSGRIMAVSLDGPGGENFGFVSEKALANRGNDAQFNAYGGALRWWIGPEGGQYGIAFAPGTRKFDLSSWHISEEYNGKSLAVVYPDGAEGSSALMGTECRVENASGAQFHIGISCRISLMNGAGVGKKLPDSRKKIDEPVAHLGYRCEMTFENLSSRPMRKETGLISIWLLGMYLAGPRTYVIAPFEVGGSGEIVTGAYFSPEGLSDDRLFINKKGGYLLFRADGKERSKIGLSRSRAGGSLASVDFGRNLLTVWRFPVSRRRPYVNSLWEFQKRPFAGDVVNSYNDDGRIGDFYELECSSPALALGPGEPATFPLEIHHFSHRTDSLMALMNGRLGRRIPRNTKFFS